MIRNAKDLSPEEKLAIEGFLGRTVSQNEYVSVRAMHPAPEWLEKAWKGAQERGLDRLTADEVQSEIDAYRRERKQASSEETR